MQFHLYFDLHYKDSHIEWDFLEMCELPKRIKWNSPIRRRIEWQKKEKKTKKFGKDKLRVMLRMIAKEMVVTKIFMSMW